MPFVPATMRTYFPRPVFLILAFAFIVHTALAGPAPSPVSISNAVKQGEPKLFELRFSDNTVLHDGVFDPDVNVDKIPPKYLRQISSMLYGPNNEFLMKHVSIVGGSFLESTDCFQIRPLQPGQSRLSGWSEDINFKEPKHAPPLISIPSFRSLHEASQDHRVLPVSKNHEHLYPTGFICHL
ncbi:hypothetical protein C8R42DRAFT_689969 [Lentinula raphanica]|nr:hypothetical protein C8R42DRAFT_689969 [Lentinula raphanica]